MATTETFQKRIDETIMLHDGPPAEVQAGMVLSVLTNSVDPVPQKVLVGDVNEVLGMCDCCSYNKREVLAWGWL